MNINKNIELFYILLKYQKFFYVKTKEIIYILFWFKNINFKFIIINKIYSLKIEIIKYWFSQYK